MTCPRRAGAPSTICRLATRRLADLCHTAERTAAKPLIEALFLLLAHPLGKGEAAVVRAKSEAEAISTSAARGYHGIHHRIDRGRKR